MLGEMWDCQLGNLTAGKVSGGGGRNNIEQLADKYELRMGRKGGPLQEIWDKCGEGYKVCSRLSSQDTALHHKWRAKVTAIEESKDLTSLSLDELIGNLKVHEMIIKKDVEIVKAKVERKSLALKAKKESSDEECSTLKAKRVQEVFQNKRYGDPNHLIGECPKPPKDKNQRAFIRGSWSYNDEEDDEKVNNETCLVAQASSEICLGVDLEPDEWIKDRGCSKHMTGNQKLFSSYKAYNGASKKLVRNLSKLKFDQHLCDACKIGKQAHASHKAKNIVPMTRCLKLLHMDLFGSSAVRSYEGNRYTLVIVDDNSRHHPWWMMDDDLDEEDANKVTEKKNLENDIVDETVEIDEILVPQHRNMTIIGTKLVFRNKLDENGIVSRNKARLVAQGYNQQEGIDYDETYGPVARLKSIRILLAYACALDFKLFQVDVKSAFLNGFINESDSEVEVVFDKTANSRLSTSGKDGSDKGYDTNSLLEQWRDSYPDNDDYDPYDHDMYENHDMSEHLHSICDDLDITFCISEQWRDSYPDNDDYDPYDHDMYENHDMSEHLQSICDDLDITVFQDGLRRSWNDEEFKISLRLLLKALIDFSTKRESSKPKDQKVNQEKGGGEKNAQPKVDTARKPPTGKDKNLKTSYKSGGCFICDGPHRARDCPKKASLNGMSAHEDEEASDGGSMGSIRILNAIKAKMEESKVVRKGLQYVEATINGVKVCALVDSGATHNFVADDEAKRLGINATKGSGTIKAVNSLAKAIHGVAKDVWGKIGEWEGMIDLLVVPIDDFKVVLGLEFLDKVRAFPMPFANSLCILDGGKTFIVSTERDAKSGAKTLSAMQFKKGFNKSEPCYLVVTRLETDEGSNKVEVPKVIEQVLDEFKDVMPKELPKKLPPRREVDHTIELETGSKPPAKAPYRMPPPELEELRKQLKELIDAGYIRP
ncbi:retrovirus-related pol polyprotein from transposon TNT 1-94 [Tanacetum coccineum]|uniref:Retrovirus-related pol polyprotein from transposon TNT 1-94 n=1 Tax=Tanacetum coccineum TaxID=301880 RepID=A0ABQ5C4X3_9ASTR